MCQLLGMNCATPTDVTFSFTGFAARGGGTNYHGDGFGIAFFEDKACRMMIDNQPAATSPIADLVKELSDQVAQCDRAHPQGDAGHRRSSRTATRSCASCGDATGSSRTTAT